MAGFNVITEASQQTPEACKRYCSRALSPDNRISRGYPWIPDPLNVWKRPLHESPEKREWHRNACVSGSHSLRFVGFWNGRSRKASWTTTTWRGRGNGTPLCRRREISGL